MIVLIFVCNSILTRFGCFHNPFEGVEDRTSVAVEEVRDSLVVVFLSEVGPTVYGQRELLFGSRSAALGLGVALLEEGLYVRVVVCHGCFRHSGRVVHHKQ